MYFFKPLQVKIDFRKWKKKNDLGRILSNMRTQIKKTVFLEAKYNFSIKYIQRNMSVLNSIFTFGWYSRIPFSYKKLAHMATTTN